jgi:DNA (cytosine-5)-methyltransferase 1
VKILNLYAGIGGNRKLWGDEHEITAVELNPKVAAIYKSNFPNDIVIIGDAHQYLKENYKEFGFVWGSPPCQKHSQMMRATRHDVIDYIDISLYQEIIFLTHFFKGLLVIENVIPYYKPLIDPSVELDRHYFWTNFKITPIIEPTRKSLTKMTKEDLCKWLGFDDFPNIYLNGNHCERQVLRNCVHPETGLHILNCALNKFEYQKQNQLKLEL